MPRKRKSEKPAETETTVGAPETTDKSSNSQDSKEATPPAPGTRSFKYLNMVAEPGGYLIGVEDRQVERPMDQNDLMDAAEESARIAHEMETAEEDEVKAAEEARSLKKLLDGAREREREAIKKQRELGKNLKAVAIQIETAVRRVTTRVNLTVTRGEELVAVDAETGQELERRTAKPEEVAKSRGKQQGLFLSVVPAGAAAPPAPGGSGDSATAKPNPEAAPVVISVDERAYDGLKKAQRHELNNVPLTTGDGEDEPENLSVSWALNNPIGPTQPGRLYAEVPAWAARALRVVAEGLPALDFVSVSRSADVAPAAKAASNVIPFGEQPRT